MKIIFLLLFLVSCASKTKKLTLELMDQNHEFNIQEEYRTITISMPNQNPMILTTTRGTDYIQEAYFGEEDSEGNRWYISELTGEDNNWVYSIFLATPDSKMGKRITSKSPDHPSINYSKCVKENNNKYLISFMLGDMGGLYVGCLK